MPAVPSPAASAPSLAAPALAAILHEVFGYPAFRGPQAEIVAHAAAGGDGLVLMPTGGGKSLCYQIPAIARHRAGLGVTIVVSPLIALMHDQVGALDEAGVPAAFLNSTLDGAEAARIERAMLAGELVLVYVAPERLSTPRMQAQLDAMAAAGRLSLFAIDEAHCVSQWGHDFREDYLALSMLAERHPGVPRLALTATADAHTRADILERLALQDARVFLSSFDRPNIAYRVVEKDEPRRQLLAWLRAEHEGEAGIVYCQSRKKVEDTAAWLSAEGIPALPYHAGLDAGLRQRHQDRFLREEGLVMVATVAFGMGIDKPDVRFVAHLDLPKNIEAYYQETGRGGRDGEPAEAWMAYGLADVVQQRRMIDEGPADETFKRLQRDKLDALLALAEATDCRRVRLLRYFDEGSTPCQPGLQQLCDNCRQPPATWDGTEAARKLLSTLLRIQQHARDTGRGARAYGAGHVIDILRGKRSDKVAQTGHEQLSTWAIGADLAETQWRSVLRQLIALGHVLVEGEYQTLAPSESARAVLRGEVALHLRQAAEAVRGRPKAGGGGARRTALPPVDLDAAGRERLAALKAWRGEVAREHNLPAYIVFNDATLLDMARRAPATLDELAEVHGVGAKKLEAYGRELIRVLDAAAGG
ncbi:DNA helicase RecQ [Aquariibacter albus]|uniref:DNA helicase RecQ n=1 Tax=Aquariibacter albus TaxID=2759899 RepID=UPI001F405AA6